MEHQQKQQGHAHHVEPQTQPDHRQNRVQHGHNPGRPQGQHRDAHNHQHQLIGDGDDGQHHRGHGHGDAVPAHIEHLHGLASRGGGGNGAVEKPNEGVKTAPSQPDAHPQGPGQVVDHHGFPQDEAHHAYNARQQPRRVRLRQIRGDLPWILSPEDRPYRQSEHRCQERHIGGFFPKFLHVSSSCRVPMGKAKG